MTAPTGESVRHGAQISEAARWLATTPQHMRPHPIIPHLKKAFGLSPKEAAEAIQEANLIRARAT